MSVNDYNEALYDAVQDLGLDEKSAAYGIAMQVVHNGIASLSPKQRYIYQTQVEVFLIRQAKEEEFDRLYDPN